MFNVLGSRVGWELPAWVLGIERSALVSVLAYEPFALGDDEGRALHDAFELTGDVALDSHRDLIAQAVARDDNGDVRAVAARERFTGLAHECPDTDDELVRALFELARDLYPGLLARWPGLYVEVHREALATAAESAPAFSNAVSLLAYELRFIPSDDRPTDDAGRRANVETLDGVGEQLDAWRLPLRVLETSTKRVIARGGTLTPGELYEQVAHDIDELRDLAAGRRRNIPVVVVIRGVGLAEDQRADLNTYGILRPPHAREKATVPNDMTAGRSTVMLQRTRQVGLVVVQPPGSGMKFNPEHWNEHPDVQAAELAAFACVVAPEREVPCSATVLYPITLYPLGLRNGFPSALQRGTGWRSNVLTDEEIVAIERFASRLRQHHHESVAISVRRLLSSLARDDAEDGLIDAVMVWENLVGAENETTFRVTAALALLLETDPARRAVALRTFRAVYNCRSKVVHGAQLPANTSLAKMRRIATETAVAALRRLYSDFPELLSDQRRGTRLLLGDLPALPAAAAAPEPSAAEEI